MALDADVIDSRAAAFIARSPLLFLLSGTTDTGPDVSPRGDGPGFVKLVGRRKLLVPDRVGNNRLDSMRNILVDPRVALVFVCGGEDRALHVFGTASISTEPALRASCAINGREPRSLMVVEVEQVKLVDNVAFAAAGFWRPEESPSNTNFSLGAALAQQIGGVAAVDETEKLVADDYKTGLY